MTTYVDKTNVEDFDTFKAFKIKNNTSDNNTNHLTIDFPETFLKKSGLNSSVENKISTFIKKTFNRLNEIINYYPTTLSKTKKDIDKEDYMYFITKIEEIKYKFSNGENMLELDDYYNIKNWNEIGNFLIRHKYLISFAKDLSIEIQSVFGDEVEIDLELVKGQDDNDKILFALINTNLDVDEALENIDMVEEKWFLDNLYKAKGRFNFDVSW